MRSVSLFLRKTKLWRICGLTFGKPSTATLTTARFPRLFVYIWYAMKCWPHEAFARCVGAASHFCAAKIRIDDDATARGSCSPDYTGEWGTPCFCSFASVPLHDPLKIGTLAMNYCICCRFSPLIRNAQTPCTACLEMSASRCRLLPAGRIRRWIQETCVAYCLRSQMWRNTSRRFLPCRYQCTW